MQRMKKQEKLIFSVQVAPKPPQFRQNLLPKHVEIFAQLKALNRFK